MPHHRRLVLRRLLLVLTCAGIAGCTRSAPAPAQPLPSDPAAALAWLPSDVTWVTHQGGTQIVLISYVRNALKEGAPSCFGRLSGQAAHVFMLSRFVGDPSLNAVYGLTDREAAEECAADTFRALTGRRLTLDRDGALTRASAGRDAMYLGWAADGWLYFDPDRLRVEAMLERAGAPTLAPSLRPLLARVSLADGFWSVFAGDLTNRFIGVPSTGFVQRFSLQQLKQGKGRTVASGVPVTFIFGSEGEASRAVEALVAAAANEEFPPPLRNALSGLRPTQRGAEVDADAALLMMDAGAMQAAAEIVKQRAAQR